jgi:hypothetical protein
MEKAFDNILLTPRRRCRIERLGRAAERRQTRIDRPLFETRGFDELIDDVSRRRERLPQPLGLASAVWWSIRVRRRLPAELLNVSRKLRHGHLLSFRNADNGICQQSQRLGRHRLLQRFARPLAFRSQDESA